MKKSRHDFGSVGKYIGALIACAVIWILMFWRGGGFTAETGEKLLRAVSDAFFVSGAAGFGLVAVAGLLTALNTGGAFDIVSYSFARLSRRASVKGKSFYEFCEEKKDGRVIRWFIVIAGAVFILAAVLFSSPIDKFLALVLFGIHFGGCVGDLYDTLVYLFKYKSPDTLMNDTGPKQTFYVK